jgi:hypothetical protein
VRSEWFLLNSRELQQAVLMSERLAKEAFVHLPVIEKAKKLASVVSTDKRLTATSDAREWHVKLMTAKEALKHCRELRTEYSSIAADLSARERKQAELEDLIVTERYVATTFDEAGFAAKHPRIFERFLTATSSVSGRFTPARLTVDLAEMDRELSDFGKRFSQACGRVRNGKMKFGDLFALHQDLEYFEGAYLWDEEIADAQLRVMCGTASGIDGLCTWNRTEKTNTHLDREGLEAAHSAKVAAFTSIEIKTRTKTKKRSRRHR